MKAKVLTLEVAGDERVEEAADCEGGERADGRMEAALVIGMAEEDSIMAEWALAIVPTPGSERRASIRGTRERDFATEWAS